MRSDLCGVLQYAAPRVLVHITEVPRELLGGLSITTNVPRGVLSPNRLAATRLRGSRGKIRQGYRRAGSAVDDWLSVRGRCFRKDAPSYSAGPSRQRVASASFPAKLGTRLYGEDAHPAERLDKYPNAEPDYVWLGNTSTKRAKHEPPPPAPRPKR